MVCQNCGAETKGKFCPMCGTRVVVQEQPVYQQPVENMQIEQPISQPQQKTIISKLSMAGFVITMLSCILGGIAPFLTFGEIMSVKFSWVYIDGQISDGAIFVGLVAAIAILAMTSIFTEQKSIHVCSIITAIGSCLLSVVALFLAIYEVISIVKQVTDVLGMYQISKDCLTLGIGAKLSIVASAILALGTIISLFGVLTKTKEK